jgi:hypothetical protein
MQRRAIRVSKTSKLRSRGAAAAGDAIAAA